MDIYNKVLPEFASAIREGLVVARFLPPLAWDIEVIRSFALRSLAVDMLKPNDYTLNLSQVASALFGLPVRATVDEWRAKIIAERREPLLDDPETVERDLDRLQRQEIEEQVRSKRRESLTANAAVVASVYGILCGLALMAVGFIPRDVLPTYISNILPHVQSPFLTLFAIAMFSFTVAAGWYILRGHTRSAGAEELYKRLILERQIADLNARRQRLRIAVEAAELQNRQSRA